MDYEVIKHFHKKEFNTGEFISYQLPIGNWENIELHFNKLLDKNFLEQLITLKTKNTFSGFYGPNPKEFESNVPAIIADLKKVFELRHIICHEMAINVKIDIPEMWRIFKSVRAFIYQVYNYINPILNPDLNIEESVLAENAKERYVKLNEELNELVEVIKKNPTTSGDIPVDLKLFLESQEHWKKYITSYVKGLYSKLGNDVFKLYYYEDLGDFVEDRIEELKLEFFTEY
ncbi:MAG: hypothetical protein IPL10_12355 [Bacteroidetes bacterium]|nr:hypothetical protein [Bacteroidota bacterium]